MSRPKCILYLIFKYILFTFQIPIFRNNSESFDRRSMLLQVGEDLPLEFVDESNLSPENVDSGEKHYADYTVFSTKDKLQLVHKNRISQNYY